MSFWRICPQKQVCVVLFRYANKSTVLKRWSSETLRQGPANEGKRRKSCCSRVPLLMSSHRFRNRGTVLPISTIWRRNGNLRSRRRRTHRWVRTRERTWIRRNTPMVRWWVNRRCRPMRRGGGRWPSSCRDYLVPRCGDRLRASGGACRSINRNGCTLNFGQ